MRLGSILRISRVYKYERIERKDDRICIPATSFDYAANNTS